MRYRVRVIEDDELPADAEWAFVRQDGDLWFWLTRSAAESSQIATVLEEAWRTFRRIDEGELLSWSEAV